MSNGVRYTKNDRLEIAEQAQQFLDQGESMNKVAKRLSITPKTLHKWLAEYKGKKPAAAKSKAAPKAAAASQGKSSRSSAVSNTRVRYTPEQKQQMKERALQLRAAGKSQKAVAEDLGVAIQTLVNLIKDKSVPAKGGSAAPAPKRHAGSNDDPVLALASMRERLQEVDSQLEALQDEKKQLQDEMKRLHKRIGEELSI